MVCRSLLFRIFLLSLFSLLFAHLIFIGTFASCRCEGVTIEKLQWIFKMRLSVFRAFFSHLSLFLKNFLSFRLSVFTPPSLLLFSLARISLSPSLASLLAPPLTRYLSLALVSITILTSEPLHQVFRYHRCVSYIIICWLYFYGTLCSIRTCYTKQSVLIFHIDNVAIACLLHISHAIRHLTRACFFCAQLFVVRDASDSFFPSSLI